MKKLIAVAAIAAFVLPLCAATAASEMVTAEDVADELTVEEDNGLDVKVDAPRKNVALWPAFIAVWDFPETPDLVGLRLTIPCSTKQENVTGLDVGFWGRSEYFEGIQLNVLRNDVRDSCAGIQVGCYNSVARGDLFAVNNVNITGLTFTNGLTAAQGGAIGDANAGNMTTLTDCVFTNTTAKHGGAISLRSGGGTISNVQITSGYASGGSGGGIELASNTAITGATYGVEGTTITNCRANLGGGIEVYTASAVVTNTTVTGCTTTAPTP